MTAEQTYKLRAAETTLAAVRRIADALPDNLKQDCYWRPLIDLISATTAPPHPDSALLDRIESSGAGQGRGGQYLLTLNEQLRADLARVERELHDVQRQCAEWSDAVTTQILAHAETKAALDARDMRVCALENDQLRLTNELAETKAALDELNS